MEDKRIIELLLAVIFVGILLVASVIVISSDEGRESLPSKQYVTNNYNSYQTNNYNQYQNTKTEYVPVNDVRVLPSNYLYPSYYDYDTRGYVSSIDYIDYGNQRMRQDFIGSYVHDYYVSVLNKENVGRYYGVRFYFEDKNGYDFSQLVTKYIQAGDSERFVYRDIQYEKNEIVDWDYEVIAEER